MSNSWWTWATDVDAAIEKKKEHQIESLKDQNKALLQKVECLESENEALNRKVDWLYMMVNKMDSLVSQVGNDGVKLPSTSSGPPSTSSGNSSAHAGSGIALALHGGYVHPQPHCFNHNRHCAICHFTWCIQIHLP